MTTQFPRLGDIPAASWERLSKKKIYFGHHSVGFNIIDGIRDLMEENPQIKLNIVETADPGDFKAGIFAHSRVGENVDPKSKIDAFANFIEQGIGSIADIAFFKFCYVDFDSNTDVKKIYEDYKDAMSRMKKRYPAVTFLHVTVPLRTTKTTWKTTLKKLIGKKDIWEYADNVPRNEFNELLMKEYDGKEPIFNLAQIESTFPDGRRSSFTKDGKTYYSLVPDYTYDGGHLNEKGRKKLAEQLLIFLAKLSG